MSNELILSPAYDDIPDVMAFVRESGTIIAKSRMFGCETIEQGQAMSLIAVTERLPFLELRRRYHVIGGDLTMRADYMRSELRRLGGQYRWVKDGEDGVEARMWIKFKQEEREVSYTIADAKKEGLVKAKSRWEKAPGDMLRARCSTKAIRMMASEVLCGFYTDEELGHEDDNGKAPTVIATPASSVVTAEVQTAKPEDVQYATGQQATRITELFVQLGTTGDEQSAIQKRKGVSSWRNLTGEQADELIGKLTAKLEASKLPATAMTAEVNTAPCTQAKIDEAKAVIREIAQNADPKIAEKVQGKLKEVGLSKLADLTMAECDGLIAAMRIKNLEGFFSESLAGHAKFTATTPAAATTPAT